MFLLTKIKCLDKMCVAEELLGLCQQMSQEITKSTVKITCVAARDRYANKNDVCLSILIDTR